MKCQICGDKYVLRNKHGGRPRTRPICAKGACKNRWTYLSRQKYYQKKKRDAYWEYKRTRYEHLRSINTRAKHRQRYGVSNREHILDKFGHKCLNCGENKKRLVIHHIDNEGRRAQELGRKPNNDPANLVPLCDRCHVSHHRWGKKLKLKI